MGHSSSSLNRRTFTISAGAAALAVGTATRTMAQDATPVAGPPELPPLPEGATVVATGLYNPRYIAIADDGTLYITEQGTGGDETFTFGPPPDAGTPEAPPQATPVTEEGTPAAEEAPPTRGYTGQITQVAPDGTQSVAVTGLASYSIGVGPVGIAIQDGTVYFSIGGTAVAAGIEPLNGENALHSFDAAAGTTTQIAEFNTYEVENNPDGTDVNPNLYAVSVGDSDGRLTVNDAGSNTIFSVDPATGEFSLRGIVPDLNSLTAASETPITDEPARQPVPTAGAYMGTTYYVGLLSEGWPENGPSVVKVDGDGQFATFTSVTTGRSMVTGLAVGPDGKLYLSQLMDVFGDGPPIGTIFRVNTADGSVEAVVEGLVMPHGIAFDGDGNLYATVYALMSGPGMAAGQVVRIDGIAAPA